MGLTDAERRELYAGFEDAIHRGRAIRAGADPDKMIDERLRQVRRWAAAWKRAAKRLAVGFLNERRAVEALAEQCASQKPQRMPWMGCPVPAPDGYPGCLLGGRRPDCVRCWSEWAREQAREEAAKTGTTQKGNG